MAEPRKVRVGEAVKAEHINALVEAVLEARLQKGVGYGLRRGPGGTTLQIFGARSSGDTIITNNGTHPYQGFDASTTSATRVVVQIGSHNSVVPLIGAVTMSVDTLQNVVTLSLSDTVVYATAVTAFSTGDVTIDAGSSLPSSTTSTWYQALFYVSVTTGAVSISDNVSGSQAYQYCEGHLFGLV
jgi:hypothetical protein